MTRFCVIQLLRRLVGTAGSVVGPAFYDKDRALLAVHDTAALQMTVKLNRLMIALPRWLALSTV
jgi:hypothetical protein